MCNNQHYTVINFWNFTTRKEGFINPLTPKITDFLTRFWPLLPKRKRENIMFFGLHFRFMKSKLHYRAFFLFSKIYHVDSNHPFTIK